jgi:hypothetical protein
VNSAKDLAGNQASENFQSLDLLSGVLLWSLEVLMYVDKDECADEACSIYLSRTVSSPHHTNLFVLSIYAPSLLDYLYSHGGWQEGLASGINLGINRFVSVMAATGGGGKVGEGSGLHLLHTCMYRNCFLFLCCSHNLPYTCIFVRDQQ